MGENTDETFAALLALPPVDWASRLDVSPDEYLALGIAVVESLLPEWNARNPKDSVPRRAVQAARGCLTAPSADHAAHAKVLAKGCTMSRKKSLGYDHRIAESARAIALAGARSGQARIDAVGEALQRAEAHRAYIYSVEGIYGKEAEIREGFVEIMRGDVGGGGRR